MEISMQVLVLAVLVSALASTCCAAKKKTDALEKYCNCTEVGKMTMQSVAPSQEVFCTCRDLTTYSFSGVKCSEQCQLPSKCGRKNIRRYKVETQYYIFQSFHKDTNESVDVKVPIACNCVKKGKRQGKQGKRTSKGSKGKRSRSKKQS